MVMPLVDLRAIYELLFRDGVIVAKKDKRPQSMHPDIKGITNLKVISAMGSLKSKGCVKETFAWKHAYYYITNKGIAYLRDYLHLPPEIMPAPLQRVWRPASAARVQTVKGPTRYAPKSKPGRESQEIMMDRHIYRHKRVGEEREQSERPPKNLTGSCQCGASVGQPGVQTQSFSKRDEDFCREEERGTKQDNRKSFGAPCLPTEYRATKCPASEKEAKLFVSLVPSSSVVTKFSQEMPSIHLTPCDPKKKVLQKCVKMTAGNPPAAFKWSECVKMQDTALNELTEYLIPDMTRGETSNLDLEVLGEVVPKGEPGEQAVMDRQTVPLLAELTEKEKQQEVKDEEGVLEDVDVVTEDIVETCKVDMMKMLNVEDFCPVTKAKADPYHDSATPTPSTATDKFRDLKEEKVVDCDIDDVKNTQKVMEKTFSIKAISEFHFSSETSSSEAFEAGCPGPVVPSEDSVTALKTPLLQEDQGFLSEDPEKEEDVQKFGPDFFKGLSLSYSSFFSSSSVSSSVLLSAVEAIWALLWALLVFGNLREG